MNYAPKINPKQKILLECIIFSYFKQTALFLMSLVLQTKSKNDKTCINNELNTLSGWFKTPQKYFNPLGKALYSLTSQLGGERCQISWAADKNKSLIIVSHFKMKAKGKKSLESTTKEDWCVVKLKSLWQLQVCTIQPKVPAWAISCADLIIHSVRKKHCTTVPSR